MKKLWILCLSLWVLCGTFVCFAAEETLATSGTCGENVTWEIFSSSYEDEYGDMIYEKTLVISGEGAMLDYSETNRPEWITHGDGLSEYMKEIVIEDGITHIGSHAFTGMTAETIHIGADVESIGKNAFCEIYGAYQMIVSEENTAYKDVAGVLFDKAGTTLLRFPQDRIGGTYTVPEGVKTIDARAFQNAARLENIRLPLSLTSIGADAFSGCEKLANVRMTGGSDVLWSQVAIADGNDALSLAARTYAPVAKASGSFGEALTWTFDDFGVLTIGGVGAMPEFASDKDAPWYAHRFSVYEIVIEDGVTSISDCAFYNYFLMYTAELGDDVKDIGYRAFWACNAMYEITLGDSIETIGKQSFAGCERLAHAKLPNSLKTIGEKAFYGCSNLLSVHIPDTTTSLGKYAFYGCENIRTAEIGSGVTVLEDDTFALCSRMESLTLKGDITSIGTNAFAHCNSLKGIVLPESLQTIEEDAFSYCTDLEEIVIPSGVTVLKENVFCYCISLKHVTMGSAVTEIKDKAFRQCFELQEITLPESLTSIGMDAFSACENLQTVTISKNVTSIGKNAFASCIRLKNIEVAEENAVYASEDGILCNKQKTTILCCPAGIEKSVLTIPPSVVTIGESAFKGNQNITSLSIPENVTTLGSAAFHSMTKLKSVEIPESVTNIGDGLFSHCTALETVKLPKNLTRIGVGMFALCTALYEYTIPEGIESIGEEAFAACENLTCVTIPESVTTIEDYAFLECASLTDIYYDGSSADWAMVDITPHNDELEAATIHYAIESGTCGENLVWTLTEDGVLTISGTGEMDNWDTVDFTVSPEWTYKYKTEGWPLREVIIEEGVTSIGAGAFLACDMIENIELPESLESIKKMAFVMTENLKSIYIPKNVCEIEDNPFCFSEIEEITVDEENPYVKAEDNVVYSKDGKTLIAYAPRRADSIFIVPDSVEAISYAAFADSQFVEEIVLPDGVLRIEHGAFSDCSQLQKISIPRSVVFIGDQVCGYSENDIVIYYGGSTLDWGKIEIDSNNDELKAATIHYAIESGTCGENLVWTLTQDGVLTISGTGDMATWTTNEDIPWQDKKEQITEIYVEEGVTSISDGAFAFCAAVTKVRMPSGLQSIGASAFSFCTALSDVILPSEGLVSIGDYAFRASGVTRLDFNDGLESIGRLAFVECTQLTYVGLPKSLHSYSLINPFYGCTSLEQILPAMGTTGVCTDGDALYTYDGTILLCYPAAQNGDVFGTDEDWGLTAIGLGAFSYANNLKKVYLPDGVTQIWSEAFSHCAALTSIAIPATMQSIDQGAFVGCENLTEILFAGSEEEWNAIVIGDDNECLKNAAVYYNTLDRGYVGENILWTYTTDGKMTISGTGEMIFEPYEEVKYWRYAQEVTALEIQSGITTIADVAFDDFNKITELTIPEGVVHIGRSAFMDCRKLTEIQLPNSLKTIGNHAFDTCFRLENITIPDSVESIGDFAFWQCSAAKTLHIGKGVTSIGAGAFGLSKQLETFTIDEANTAYCIEDGILYTKDKKKLVFYMMNKTGVCTVPNGVVSIAPYAFSMHEGLTGVILPETLTSLGNNAFEYCFGIEKIIIPDSVTQIHEKAFQYCENLVSVVMGSGIKLMEEDVFGFCKNLRNIYYKGTPSAWNQIDIQKGHYILSRVTIHYAKTFSVTETVQEKEAVTVTVLLEEKPEEGVVMLASYDKDGRFIGFDKQSMPEGNTATLSVTAAEGGTYKTMLWQAVGDLQPLSAAE